MRNRVIAIAAFLALGFPHVGFAAPVPFPDMQHSWFRYREAVAYLQGRGIIEGYADGTFRPSSPINRAELLKIVFKGGSEPIEEPRRCFSDVNPDTWYASYVCAAKRRGIISGYPDGTYKPDQTVNFAEAIKITLRAYGREITEMRGEKWFEPYAAELEDKDILASSSYIPWDSLTRERAADLIARIVRFDEERVIPKLSPGCGKAKPAPPSTVTVNGQARDFLLTVPGNASATDPLPLIVAFHGRTNSNEQVRKYYRLDREMNGYLIAYPAAIRNKTGSFSWSNPGDIDFFDALVELLGNEYCVDMDRIFVVGHSLGAWFSNTVACIRGGVVRGSATVGGGSTITDCAGPSAALIAHHPRDQQDSFAGAEKARELRVRENGCAFETDPAQGFSALLCVRHRECPSGNDVLWCPHEIDNDERGEYYPHHWPRITASLIASFFASLR